MFLVSEISKLINGKIIGDSDFLIEGICGIKNGKVNHMTYLKDSSYKRHLKKSNASVFIIDKDFNEISENKTYIKVNNSGLAFIKVLKHFKKKLMTNNKKNNTCKAKILDNVNLGKNVHIGRNSIIYPGCYLGDNSTVGKNSILYPNTILYNDVEIGNNCVIDAGCVIGADGFGLIQDNGISYNIPHIGKVLIGDNVTIGSNTCIDRGTIDATVIGDNVKIDNMVQIAHNVKINNNCVIAGQVGIAGSTVLYENVKIGGGTSIIDNLEIGKNSVILGNSFVWKNVKENSFISGNPAEDHKLRLKKMATLNRLLSKRNNG
tara:strand:- start:12223 stop:13179 length:957 start_codon:yes stop_codon:yes gene_type:complete